MWVEEAKSIASENRPGWEKKREVNDLYNTSARPLGHRMVVSKSRESVLGELYKERAKAVGKGRAGMRSAAK